jgi:hypothetical protein
MSNSVTYTTKYKKNTGAVLSPTELRDLYLHGINVKSRDGSELPTYTWEAKIKNAQQQIEKFLAIKLIRQLWVEKLTYFRDDYLNNLPILNTSLPVYKTIRLLGLLNGVEQIRYPEEWCNQYESTDQGQTRRINIVPSGSATGAATNVVLLGVMAQLGIRSLNLVPNYWTVNYLTGWTPDALPQPIVDIIGKLAAIQILAIAGDLVLSPGLSGQSLSIDGLSQSLNTAISGQNSAFGGRIKQYTQDIKDTLQQLERSYKGINFVVL